MGKGLLDGRFGAFGPLTVITGSLASLSLIFSFLSSCQSASDFVDSLKSSAVEGSMFSRLVLGPWLSDKPSFFIFTQVSEMVFSNSNVF